MSCIGSQRREGGFNLRKSATNLPTLRTRIEENDSLIPTSLEVIEFNKKTSRMLLIVSTIFS